MRRKLDITYDQQLELSRAILMGETTTKEVAAQYGIHRNTTASWVRLFSVDIIRDLTTENRRLKSELNEIQAFKQQFMDKVFFEDNKAFLIDDAGFKQRIC